MEERFIMGLKLLVQFKINNIIKWVKWDNFKEVGDFKMLAIHSVNLIQIYLCMFTILLFSKTMLIIVEELYILMSLIFITFQ